MHACNTAGAIALPGARYDMVRVGIGIYGIAPSAALAGRVDLKPALSVKARVSHVQALPAGARLSYGLRYETTKATRVATVPIGYADGVPRELAHRDGAVLDRRPAMRDRGNGHDGPAHGRRRRSAPSRSATRSC